MNATVVTPVEAVAAATGTFELTLKNGATLIIEPRRVVDPAEFKRSAPRYSLGLDGYVSGVPWFDVQSKHGNFNHHEDVFRFATLATCGQIMMALKAGLPDAMKRGGAFRPTIFVNDCDQDVCTSVWLLDNHSRVSGTNSEPLINQLVGLENSLDISAGAYPIKSDVAAIRKLAWVFEPYTEARQSGRIAVMGAAEMANVISTVLGRIDQFVMGCASERALDTRYNIIGGGEGWKMIIEHGAHARTAFVADGNSAFVSARTLPDERYRYSIGKISPFVDFPVKELYDVLNAAEGIGAAEPDRWGGGDTIGGSPRNRCSRLTPTQVEHIINDYLRRREGHFEIH